MSYSKHTFCHEINNRESDSDLRRFEDQMYWVELEEDAKAVNIPEQQWQAWTPQEREQAIQRIKRDNDKITNVHPSQPRPF
jgi:hypothetical protein